MWVNPSSCESRFHYYCGKKLAKWKEKYPMTAEPRPKEVEKYAKSIYNLMTKKGKKVYELFTMRLLWGEIVQYITYHKLESYIKAIDNFYNDV